MSTTDTAALRSFCDGLPEPDGDLFPAPAAGVDPLVHELILSMLVWNATPSQAAAAMGRLVDSVVDVNELRVCFADDLTALMGPRYPRVEERAERLLRVLNAVFSEEHAMTLEALRDANKRDARAYLDAIDGIVAFAAARVFLLGLGGHAMPMDDRMTEALIERGALPEDTDAAAASSLLERTFRAGEAEAAFRKLESELSQKASRTPSSRRKRGSSESRPKRSSAKS